jgi:hypothetical protein
MSTHAQIFHCAEKADFRLADDAGGLHPFAQFRGLDEFLQFGRRGPTAKDSQVVRRIAGAKNLETFFTGRFAKFGKVANRAFPFGVIGDFVTNDDQWHTIPFFNGLSHTTLLAANLPPQGE